MKNFNILSELRPGSIVKLTTGETATFLRLKRKNFEGIINGEGYNIPIALFKEVIQKEQLNEGYKTLKKVELFVINHDHKAIIYKFVKIENDKIIGINPINSINTKLI